MKNENFVKDPSVETCAKMLYEEHGQHASSWLELKEKTRERYREMARGERPMPKVFEQRIDDED